MDIPIRFKFFDKLKLYQDYLRKDVMLEKTKGEYWLYEKAILYWAYSREHQHIGRPLDADVFCRDVERVSQLPKIAKQISNNPSQVRWVQENIENKPAAIHTIANLKTLGFVTVVSRYKKDEVDDPFIDFPNKVYVNSKGLLLGELLFETFNRPAIFTKNFRKYKLTMLIFYILFLVLIGTAFIIFIEKLVDIVGQKNLVLFFERFQFIVLSNWKVMILMGIIIYLISRFIWSRL